MLQTHLSLWRLITLSQNAFCGKSVPKTSPLTVQLGEFDYACKFFLFLVEVHLSLTALASSSDDYRHNRIKNSTGKRKPVCLFGDLTLQLN